MNLRPKGRSLRGCRARSVRSAVLQPLFRPFVLIRRNGSHPRKRECSQIPAKRPPQNTTASLGRVLVYGGLLPQSPSAPAPSQREPDCPPLEGGVPKGQGEFRPYSPEWFASARARMLEDSGKTSSPKRKRYRWFAFWFFTYPWLPQIAQYQPPENRRIPEKTFQNMRIPLANSQTKVYIIHMAYFALRSTVFPRKEFVSCSALGTGSLTLCTAQV